MPGRKFSPGKLERRKCHANLAVSCTFHRQHFWHHLAFDFFNAGNTLCRHHVSFIKDRVPEIGFAGYVSPTPCSFSSRMLQKPSVAFQLPLARWDSLVAARPLPLVRIHRRVGDATIERGNSGTVSVPYTSEETRPLLCGKTSKTSGDNSRRILREIASKDVMSSVNIPGAVRSGRSSSSLSGFC